MARQLRLPAVAHLPGLTLAVVALLLLAVCAAAAVAGAAEAGESLPQACTWHAFGGSCPGCGMTRAAVLLGRGDVAASWSAHPALLPLLALVALEAASRRFAARFLRSARPLLALLVIALSFAHWLPWMTPL